MAAEETAQFLLDKGFTPETPGERLRSTILARLSKSMDEGLSHEDALQELYPNTILDDTILEQVTAALVSGANVLLLGPPGSGKTSLARDIWDLYPKDAFVVADCPVQDDPFSLVSASHAKVVPPCPVCRANHGKAGYESGGDFDPASVNPKDVPVRKARLREGHGLSRLQGSPEVFPDYLTGALNIAKLEEIGDPESPLVLEPGKLMQANHGVLFVDEVGKLPRGTQNVLLQAFQENTVTPSKSRETFPAAFVGVTTSNTDDMDLINEPLLGRLTSIHVGFNESHEKNRAIVDRALQGTRTFIAGPFRSAAVVVTERWRRTSAGAPDLAEVGSNRTMIDVLRRAEARALLGTNGGIVTREDFERGALEAMRGRVRGRSAEGYHQNREAVEAFLEKQGKEAFADAATKYWCGFYAGVLNEDKSEAERVVREIREVLREPKRVEQAYSGGKNYPKFTKWAEYVESVEGKFPEDARAKRHEVIWNALEDAGAFGVGK